MKVYTVCGVAIILFVAFFVKNVESSRSRSGSTRAKSVYTAVISNFTIDPISATKIDFSKIDENSTNYAYVGNGSLREGIVNETPFKIPYTINQSIPFPNTWRWNFSSVSAFTLQDVAKLDFIVKINTSATITAPDIKGPATPAVSVSWCKTNQSLRRMKTSFSESVAQYIETVELSPKQKLGLGVTWTVANVTTPFKAVARVPVPAKYDTNQQKFLSWFHLLLGNHNDAILEDKHVRFDVKGEVRFYGAVGFTSEYFKMEV